MDRFILFFNRRRVGSFNSECTARQQFLKECALADYTIDSVVLVDLELDGKTIAEY